jgi:hypothetical protein
MPITGSGQIALIEDIDATFDQGTDDISLLDAAVLAGLPVGEVSMTDFYGLSSEATLTINFVDSTPTGASMSTSSFSVTGSPGSSFTTQNRTISRASNYVLSNISISESGDSGNNLSASSSFSGSTGFQNGNVAISGTIPDTTTTVTYTVSCSASLKTSRGCYFQTNGMPSMSASGGNVNMRPGYSGGGTFSGYHGGNATGELILGWYSGVSTGSSGTLVRPYWIVYDTLHSAYMGFSVGETASYQSCSLTTSKSF